MAFKDYSRIPASNQVIGDGLFIGPNMARNDVREALQQLAADGASLVEDGIKGLKGDPADGPQTVDFDTTAGQLTYPATGDFSTAVTRDGTLGFEYDSNLLVFLNEQKLTPAIDYTAPGGVGPIVLTDDPGNGKLSVTSYASEGVGTGIERLYLVHTYREDGDTNDSQAVLRTRDAIDAAGGGTMYFVRGEGSRDDGGYAFGSDTQNNDPTNEGNLCSNLIVRSDPGVTLWLDRADGPFLFFCNPAGNQGATPVQPVWDNIQFRGLVTRNDPTATGPGYEENSAFYHVNAVSNVLWERCGQIGSVGDGMYIGAGDLGPDGNGERQNRYNYNLIFRDCFWDGINTNNRNAVSIISAERVRFEGVNVSRNWGKAGSAAPFDPYDPATGIGAPAGGIDIEPNTFTTDPLVKDITGSFWVYNSGAAAFAALILRNASATKQFEGIDMQIFAEECRLGLIAFQSDPAKADKPLVRITGIARNCDKPFEVLQGAGLEINAQFYDCEFPADMSYTGGLRISSFKLTGYFERCGASGAILRMIGGSGYDFDLLFRNCPGVPIQLTGDGGGQPVVLSNSRFKIRFDPASTVFPQQRIAIDTSIGVPAINAKSVVELIEDPSPVPDAVGWIARQMFAHIVPNKGAWNFGDIIRGHPDNGPGGPSEWQAAISNTSAQSPALLVTKRFPGRPVDPTITPVTVTKTADILDEGNGRYTAQRANQVVFATNAETIGAGQPAKEWIFSTTYPGSNFLTAGITTAASPVITSPNTAAWWNEAETAKLRTIANNLPNEDGEFDRVPIGGQLRILIPAGTTQAEYYYRAGTSGTWTQMGAAKELTGSPTSVRAFIRFPAASETIQLVKQGAV